MIILSSKQIIRSGTSIGALIRESENVENKKDFIHKINIFLKKLMTRNIG